MALSRGERAGVECVLEMIIMKSRLMKTGEEKKAGQSVCNIRAQCLELAAERWRHATVVSRQWRRGAVG